MLCVDCSTTCDYCERPVKGLKPDECVSCQSTHTTCEDCHFFCNTCGEFFCGSCSHYNVTCNACDDSCCSYCIEQHQIICIHCQADTCESIGCVECASKIENILNGARQSTQNMLSTMHRSFSDCTITNRHNKYPHLQ